MPFRSLSIHLLGTTLLTGLGWIIGCKTEVEPDKNTGNQPDTTAAITADKASTYLVLPDAKKITGSQPSAADGQLKISVKDTLFVVKDFSLGARVVVKHNGTQPISGFYVGVANSSFYYDLPAVAVERQDSSDVIYLNLEIPDGEAADYPFTIPVTILPHGSDGTPLDKFDKWVTMEDPEDHSGCAITVPKTFPIDRVHWEWAYTVNTDATGNVLHLEAKGVKKVSSYQTGGCCNDDGTSTTVANDPYCTQNSPNFRPIDVSHYFMWAYDVLYLYDDGTFRQANTSVQTNYRPSLSDFCHNKAAYDFDINTFVKFGTHDFTPGANSIKFTYYHTNPPVFGKLLYSGDLLYCCHSLIISFEREGSKWFILFRKPADGVSVAATLTGWD